MNISAINNFNNRQLGFCQGKTVKALLVDDNEQVLRMTNRTLSGVVKDAGDKYEPRCFQRTAEALQALDTDQFNLVITDGSIDERGDGLDVVRKAINKGVPAQKIVMISGDSHLQEPVEELNAHFWRKPVFQLYNNLKKVIYPKAE